VTRLVWAVVAGMALRSIVRVQMESAAVWPVVFLLDRCHPAIRSGELAPLTRPVCFAQQAWRQLALGAVIGALLGPGSASAPDERAPEDGPGQGVR